ncbi:hypothetical protein MKC54_09230 [[Clostridium] innocuum]|nr:hypothetical protein [[Clostridium] innocuum]MCR0577067.1 hypothetical protein [[Clostridium] innocuum]
MELNKTYITNKGRALMAKIGAGTNTSFTKMKVSSKEYADSTASSVFEALTVLPDIKQETSISDVEIRDKVYIDITAAVSNKGLKTGYKVGCFGFYATDPTDGEILYAIAPVKQGTGDWFPADNGLNASSLEVGLTIQVGNSANVTMQVDSGAYATVSMLNGVKDQINVIKDAIGLTDDSVYGVEVDLPNRKFTRLGASKNLTPGASFDNILPYKRRRCIIKDDGTVLAYRGEPGYSETGKTTAAITKYGVTYPAGTIAQVMVEQPKYYYKIVPLVLDPIANGEGYHMRKFRAYISEEPKPGFKVHPAFVRNGETKEFIYLAAYDACFLNSSGEFNLDDSGVVTNFNANMLVSIANAKPASGAAQQLTRTNARQAAQANGAGWQLRDCFAAYSTLLLFLIEYNTFNTQAAIGRGVVDVTDDGASNLSIKTGYTSSLGNTSGSAEGVNGKVSVSYRGEENIWGNIWDWLEGINVNRDSANHVHEIYYADHGYADNIGTAPYKKFNASVSETEGYVSAFCYEADGDMDAMFIASETKAADNWGLCDYFYRNVNYKGWLAALLGGRWNNGSQAGAGCLDLATAASYRSRSIGARVLYVPAGNGSHKPE